MKTRRYPKEFATSLKGSCKRELCGVSSETAGASGKPIRLGDLPRLSRPCLGGRPANLLVNVVEVFLFHDRARTSLKGN